MKKITIAIMFLVFSVACITADVISHPVTARMKTASYDTIKSDRVVADEALHLRDFPEEYGGGVIATMPNGSEFVVRSCLTTTSGTVWAYGEYVMPEGSMYGWAAARYISGGCDG